MNWFLIIYRKDFITMENFNVGNPTKENIEYAFKNLIFYVTVATKLNVY